MSSPLDFPATFQALTGNPPFPWQQALYDRFMAGSIPASCNLPTGLGKTSVIAVWLIARANDAAVPRRLVYVVNRRTVVDQTTDEVEKYKRNAVPGVPEFALSTLRGQFADNREWSADPSKPAVICGTVDMIGSRLLFSGYGIGFKQKPLHAGFLGQDALLVHDEAHLEPAFQTLILAIEQEQKRCADFRRMRVMELTATSRGDGKAFELTDADRQDDTVRQRITAKKAIELHDLKDEKKLADQLAENALRFKASGLAVLVFVRTVDDVLKVRDRLAKEKLPAETLTGTMRGKERDELATANKTFARFLPKPPADATPGTVYLVCTSAGEVGVNISADHLVCDLSTFESMAQRLGRVNRFGARPDTEVHVVHPTKFDDDDYDQRRAKTLELLRRLGGNGSPAALGGLPTDDRQAAFAPTPVILPTTDVLFDAWALTTIRGKLPGRPAVEDYLHGVPEKQQYDTTFAWREEVALLAGVSEVTLRDLLEEFPLRPHETLRVPTFGKRAVFDQLEAIAEREPAGKPYPVWVIEPDGELTAYPTVKALLKKNGKDYAVSLASRTVVLPPAAGGLSDGTLDGKAPRSDGGQYDVAGTPPPKVAPLLRLKVVRSDGGTKFALVGPTADWDRELIVPFEPGQDRWGVLNKALPNRVKLALRIDLERKPDDDEPSDGVAEYLVVRPIKFSGKASESEWPALGGHLAGVRDFAESIAARMGLEPKLAEAVTLAAAWHDLGKGRAVWQRGAGNRPSNGPVAKTLHGRAPENLNRYRHELGSMIDAVAVPEFAEALCALDEHQRDLVLHLKATHHGRGRPHFPEEESHDPDRPPALVATVVGEVHGRFARLQRRYGRWGLAYLESLLRAADVLESRRLDAAPPGEPVPGAWPNRSPTLLPYSAAPPPTPSIAVAVDPTNPGQFFACCGLLELADRLWPGAEGWFAAAGREFKIACGGTLADVLQAAQSVSIAGVTVPDDSEGEHDDDDDNTTLVPVE